MSKNNFNDAVIRSVVAGVIAIGAGTVVSAQDAGAPALEILQDIYPGKAYSPPWAKPSAHSLPFRSSTMFGVPF